MHFVYKARSVRGRLRTTVSSCFGARSAVLCTTYFSTGNNMFRPLFASRSTVVSSSLGRTSVVSKMHLYGTGHCHCTGTSVTSLRHYLRRTRTRHFHVVIASNMFSVSKGITPVSGVYSLTRGCSTLIVMSRSRSTNIINTANRKMDRRCGACKHMSVCANALNGTFNNTLNKFAANHGRVVSLLHRHDHPCLFSGSLTPNVVNTDLRMFGVLGRDGRVRSGLMSGMGCFHSGVATTKFSVGPARDTVYTIVLCSTGLSRVCTTHVRRRNVCMANFCCPMIPGSRTHVHMRVSTNRRGRRLSGYVTTFVGMNGRLNMLGWAGLPLPLLLCVGGCSGGKEACARSAHTTVFDHFACSFNVRRPLSLMYPVNPGSS